MQCNRCIIIAIFLLACTFYTSFADFFPDEEDLFPVRHERLKRFVQFYSKKPYPDAEIEKGIGFVGHAKNFLKGGTVGVHIKNLDKFRDFFKRKFNAGHAMHEREEPDYKHLINPRVKNTDLEKNEFEKNESFLK